MELTVSERDYLLLEGRWGAIEKGQRAVTHGVIVPLCESARGCRRDTAGRRPWRRPPERRAAGGVVSGVGSCLLWLVPRQEALAGAQHQRVGVP